MITLFRPGPDKPTLNLSFLGSSLPSNVTFTRASTKWAFDSSGQMVSFATDVPAFDYGLGGTSPLGLLIEEARTNVVLYDRDLTNAAWTATNVTVAKTATGIDGVANSASTLTATAGNGTVLQAITLASSARFQTAYVKRITGSGTINMTMDNGSTWTAITVTSSWTRVSIPTQTIANPTVGFRIVTSGDAIAVDVVQNENGAFATSPIVTTSATVARSADVCVISSISGWFNTAAGTLAVEADVVDVASNKVIATFNDGTATGHIFVYVNGAGAVQGDITSSGSSTFTTSSGVAVTANTVFKAAIAYQANDAVIAANGTVSSADTSVTLPTVDRLTIGARGNASLPMSGHIRRLRYYPTRLDAIRVQTITT